MPWDLRPSISRPENFARPSSKGDDAERRVREELLVLRPREVLVCLVAAAVRPAAPESIRSPAAAAAPRIGLARKCDLGRDSA